MSATAHLQQPVHNEATGQADAAPGTSEAEMFKKFRAFMASQQ
jgi:hypothetical protein